MGETGPCDISVPGLSLSPIERSLGNKQCFHRKLVMLPNGPRIQWGDCSARHHPTFRRIEARAGSMRSLDSSSEEGETQ